jgi:hypothetical protein
MRVVCLRRRMYANAAQGAPSCGRVTVAQNLRHGEVHPLGLKHDTKGL